MVEYLDLVDVELETGPFGAGLFALLSCFDVGFLLDGDKTFKLSVGLRLLAYEVLVKFRKLFLIDFTSDSAFEVDECYNINKLQVFSNVTAVAL
jgi:hypothetical protein